MPIYLKTLDVVPEVVKFKSALIVLGGGPQKLDNVISSKSARKERS